MSPVITRPAGIADAFAIAALTAQLGYEARVEDVTGRLARLLARDDMRFIVAEQDGALVGWVHVEIAEYVETSAFAAIGGLVVNRAHRRQGIGAALMAEAESWAREQGCALMRLWSSVGRAPAHRFYEELGYRNLKTQYTFGKALDTRGALEAERLVPRVEPEPS